MSHSVHGSAVSRDGRWLATSTTDSAPDHPHQPSIFLWPLRMDDLLTLACDVGGALNEEQREEHVQDETYRAMCSDRQS